MISEAVSTERPRSQAASWLQQFTLLMRLQFADFRAHAAYLAIFSLLMPLGMFWILYQYVGTSSLSQWLLAGNLAMAVSFGAMNFAIERTALLRLMGELQYYATLPLSRSVFFSCLFVLGLITTLPPMIGNVLIGHWILGVPLARFVPVLPLTLLAGATLSIVGTTVGSLVKSNAQLTLYFYLSYMVVVFLCPIMIPLERLPLALKVTSYLLPPGQATIALTDALAGNLGTEFWVMSISLLVWLLVAGAVGVRSLDWRRDA